MGDQSDSGKDHFVDECLKKGASPLLTSIIKGVLPASEAILYLTQSEATEKKNKPKSVQKNLHLHQSTSYQTPSFFKCEHGICVCGGYPRAAGGSVGSCGSRSTLIDLSSSLDLDIDFIMA